jgi:hypothetical protein
MEVVVGSSLIRRAGFGAIAAATIAVWFLMAPPSTDPPAFELTVQDYSRMVVQALNEAEANEILADSAPQQQVVNGWVARDLFSLIALQNTDLLEGIGLLGDQNAALGAALTFRDDRTPALIALGVLALCWQGLTGQASPDAKRMIVADTTGEPGDAV